MVFAEASSGRRSVPIFAAHSMSHSFIHRPDTFWPDTPFNPRLTCLFPAGSHHDLETLVKQNKYKRKIAIAIIHPRYDQDTLNNDLGVFEVEEDFNFEAMKVTPVCLHKDSSQTVFENELIYGWLAFLTKFFWSVLLF